MGYDRIAYFNGKDNESTLLSADKSSAAVVHGQRFRSFCSHLGYSVRQVVNLPEVPKHVDAINRGAHIDTLPESTKAEVVPGYSVASGIFVELKPPVDDETVRVLNAYFAAHCEPSDAGLILDYRGDRPMSIGGF